MTVRDACPHCGNTDAFTVRRPAVLVYVGYFGDGELEHSSTERDTDPTMGRCLACGRLFKLEKHVNTGPAQVSANNLRGR
jgi:hypothetical protein